MSPITRPLHWLLLTLAFCVYISLASISAVSQSLAPPEDTSTGTLELPAAEKRQDLDLPDSILSFRFNAPTSPAVLPSTTSTSTATSASAANVYGDPLVDDLILSPLVLAVTVDGNVHAIKRETGQWVWTLHDDGGAASGGVTKEEREQRIRGGAVGGPLVKSVGRKRSNSTLNPVLGLSTDGRDLLPVELDEEIYVIEPHSAGDIYLYTPPPLTTPPTAGTLQKLPLSMTQLVSLSPFTFPSDSSRMFVGRKETKLVGVDLKSGRLVGVFGSGEGWCEWDEQREGRVKTEEESDEDISKRPEDLLYMARTEYHLLIYSKSPYSLLQTLTYTTYSSSSLGSTLQSQWTRTPDSRYLQPMHDGSLMCFIAGVPGLQWTIGFDVPVVAVFDIATPPNPSSVENSQPIMLEQPHPLPVDGVPIAFDELQELPETTFIGKIGEDLFAMSRGNFPLVAFAPLNVIIDGGVDREVDEEEEMTPVVASCVGNDCLLGSHRVQKSTISPPSIEPPPVRLGIEAPSSTPSTGLSSTTTLPSPAPPNRSATILAAIYQPVKSLSGDTRLSALGFGLLGIAGWLWGKKLWRAKSNTTVESPLVVPPTLLPTPSPPFNSSVVLPPPILHDVVKDLPPLPIIVLDDEAEGESDKEDVLGDTPKRKSRRRRGKKAKKGKEIVLFPEPLASETELENLVLVEAEEVMDVDEVIAVDPSLIGGLSVSETILGYGSHGTVVLRGEFQGRAVAVKRLLKDFVTIATHEVALLQESDDHPNVIRYFCKEQRDTFLYIALELCPASLYELIDQPQSFPELSRDLDPKKALRQITGGIRHLHQLKIVHRDIKPQNILVAPAKLGGVRMLISDFGLCKKLDLDESSFQQTVNHAAGSFGYRAPEVLRGQVDPNAGASGTPSNSTAGSVGEGASTDPSMRLTRSIDIFSLGCIFYYVLTGGEHPFGGRYEREMNILRGKVSLERLDGLGEEALEVQDAITRMVATDPRERPTAESVLLHPFFWNAQKRLLFICDASDRFEIMEREPPTATLVSLEDTSELVVGEDWSKSIDRSLLDNLGKYRKYDGKSVRDLLRVLRNKKHHYQDLPDNVRRNLGDLPGGFLSYFTTRYPRLLLHVYDVVSIHLSDEAMFASTFELPDDDP